MGPPEVPDEDVELVSRVSPYFTELVERFPELIEPAFDRVEDRLDSRQLNERYQSALSGDSENDLSARLQWLRSREMMRIIFRDLTRRASLLETTAELSHLADFCIQTALDHCYAEACEKYGVPETDGHPEKLIVIGMGKLGAYELNLSSDVDLIFFYTNPGQITQASGKMLSFQEFFLRLGRRVIACLDDAGTIGNVFRVDMRLRPYGDSGPLVLHRSAMEKYYLEQGRDWERYAYIKARIVAGDMDAGDNFLTWLKPFVYRRHLDFSAIQSLREMKSMIARQVELQGKEDDLKLGSGGIREIEFIAQAHQLIWGGRHPELQETSLNRVLGRLHELGFLPAEDLDSLRQAYTFLRNSEHAVQAEYDRQTHSLPVEEDGRLRLALALGFEDFESYSQTLTDHRAKVTRIFDELIAARPDNEKPDIGEAWKAAWTDPVDEEIIDLRLDVERMQLSDEVQKELHELMPSILQLSDGADDPVMVREEMITVVRSVLRRSTYLVFLNENTDALERAAELIGTSSWCAEQLASYPILLYELTDRSMREVVVTKQELEGELREIMRTIDAGDLETQMDTLRQFKLASTLKIAAMELQDRLSVMQASDGLTAVAEVILEMSLELAWQYLESKHGLPCDAEKQPLAQRLAIVAYGKAGGHELAYGSDLDLVFLSPDEISGYTDGHKSINNNVFYVRLGQRIIHILTSFTRFGTLYEADLRLRPQGNKGPLVATVNAYRRYEAREAWTWEHQALIRARFVAGDPSLGQAFEEIRRSTIESERDRRELLNDVMNMREKMRAHLGTGPRKRSDEGADVLVEFDLKHDAGAIVDIEFMVQYAVLGWAATHPVLSRWTDVMRLLDELMQSGLITDQQAEAMQRAYLAYRAAIHHGWLGLETDYERLQAYRTEIQQIWNRTMLQKEDQQER